MSSSIAKYDNEYLTGWNWDKDFWTIPVTMEKGHYYYIELKYYDGSWGAHINLKWFSEEYSIEAVTIPQAQLYSKLPSTNRISDIHHEKKDDPVYNIAGLRVLDTKAPGLYIKKGKKYLEK